MRLMKWMTGVVLLMLLGVLNLSAATCTNVSCITMHDTIPNFAGTPTIRSVQTGSWFNPSTWDLNRIPTVTDVVSIDAGTTVVVSDVGATALTVGIQSTAVLTFRPDIPTQLVVGTILVLPNGTFQIGSPASPEVSTAEVRFLNQPLDTTNDGIGVYDPRLFGTGLISVDGRVMLVGTPKTGYQRLSAEALIGATTVTFAQPVDGWNVGDRVFLPDSRHIANTAPSYTYRGEDRVITTIAADRKSISFAGPLQYDHPGSRDGDDVIEFYPHVGNRTRNIRFTSDVPTGTRGHVFMTERSDVFMQYVSFSNLGRTTIYALDNTTFNASGVATHIGTNQLGRYPLHIHHVYGSVVPPANGYQYVLEGNVVDDDAAINTHKWAVTLHGSHYGLIRQNVIYNAGGWGIGTEDGSESYNDIDGNFVARVNGWGSRESTESGAGIWQRGPMNLVRNNSVANIMGSQNEGSHGYQYFFMYLGNICVPKFRGADMSQCQTIDGNTMPLRGFENNEAYGGDTNIGLSFWWVGTRDITPVIISPSVVRGLRVWNHKYYGVYAYPSSKMILEDVVIRGRRAALSNINEISTGLYFSDYMMQDMTIRHADIQNQRTGIVAPFFVRGTALIEDSVLRNANNIRIATTGSPGSSGNGNTMPPKRTVVRNVKFNRVTGNVGNVPQYDIQMLYSTWFGSANLVIPDEVFVYDFNQVPGDDFQVFYNEQRPDFVVPQSSGNLVGAPVAGLTNAQLWAGYGKAIAGAVATSVQTRSGILGLVRPGTVPFPAFPPVLTAAQPIQAAAIVVTGEHAVADGSPKPVTVTTVPAGLNVQVTYDGAGAVPSLPGAYAVEVTLAEAGYSAPSISTTLFIAGPQTVGPVVIPPTSTYQLGAEASSVTIPAGGTVSFSVVPVPGASVVYQWQKNNRNISGATSSTYVTPAILASDTGAVYRCVVTGPSGRSTSGPALVIVQ